jgi:hypothetical protein
VTIGSAWNGFADERKKVRKPGSPALAISDPSAATTATAP